MKARTTSWEITIGKKNAEEVIKEYDFLIFRFSGHPENAPQNLLNTL